MAARGQSWSPGCAARSALEGSTRHLSQPPPIRRCARAKAPLPRWRAREALGRERSEGAVRLETPSASTPKRGARGEEAGVNWQFSGSKLPSLSHFHPKPPPLPWVGSRCPGVPTTPPGSGGGAVQTGFGADSLPWTHGSTPAGIRADPGQARLASPTRGTRDGGACRGRLTSAGNEHCNRGKSRGQLDICEREREARLACGDGG